MFGKEDSAEANAFAFKVVDMLVNELNDFKYNLIIESSLKRPNTALNNEKILTIKGMELNCI